MLEEGWDCIFTLTAQGSSLWEGKIQAKTFDFIGMCVHNI